VDAVESGLKKIVEVDEQAKKDSKGKSKGNKTNNDIINKLKA